MLYVVMFVMSVFSIIYILFNGENLSTRSDINLQETPIMAIMMTKMMTIITVKINAYNILNHAAKFVALRFFYIYCVHIDR